MARINEYVGNTKYHFFYSIPNVHDKESALKWVATIPSKKMFYVKSIHVHNESMKPYKDFSPKAFVEKYKDYPCEKISVLFNFHQYELMLVIDVCDYQIELKFPKETMVDYQMIEDCLQLT